MADPFLHGVFRLDTRRAVPVLGITTHDGCSFRRNNCARLGSSLIDTSKAHEFVAGSDTLFERAQNIEWLVIDENSTLGVLVCGVFDNNLRRARKRHRRSRRPDGTERPFGGINMTLAGDWWQLPPVKQTPLFANPYGKHDHGVQRSLAMFWSKRSEDSLTLVRELTRAALQGPLAQFIPERMS